LKSFNMNSFGSLSHRLSHKFLIKDLAFMGDKHQFIFLLGTLGCGLFDLLTGSGAFSHTISRRVFISDDGI